MHNLIGKKSFNTSRVHDEVSIPNKTEKILMTIKIYLRRL